MAPAKTFEPTTARGTALAEEVLATIEAEEAFNERRFQGSYHHLEKKNAWNQALWGDIHLDKLPPGTEIQLVDGVRRPRNMLVSGPLAAIDGGVTCGTAMCFAGHAVTLAGDRLLFSIAPAAAEDLKAKGFKANIKRFAKKFRNSCGWAYSLNPTVSSEYVLTREGKIKTIQQRARELLKLSRDEADALFRAGNGMDDLRRYVEEMREGRDISTGRERSRKR